MSADTSSHAPSRHIELMAPAGSWASLSAALKAGADAVYFGVGTFNMRSRSANNFQAGDLREITAKCRKFGAKAYLALNTILYDEELEEAAALCGMAKESGVDAIIAADPAVLQMVRSAGLPIHLSVQANVTNLAAVQFYAGFADVMVLARELALPQICRIIEGIHQKGILGPSKKPVQIEVFAHGALCVAYSGKCQMSLALYGPKASANRGACFQPCRRSYRVTDEETGAELVVDGHQVMSPKDLCALPFLDRILDAGVSVLKLEGRGRSPDFVATVVRVYREAIDAWRAGTFRPSLQAKGWMGDLKGVFHRGFWEGGYYLGHPLGAWDTAAHSHATEKKSFVGEIIKYYARIGVAEVFVRADSIGVGDEVWILGDTTGAVRSKVTELRMGEAGVPSARVAQGIASLPVPEKVRAGDKLYRIVPAAA